MDNIMLSYEHKYFNNNFEYFQKLYYEYSYYLNNFYNNFNHDNDTTNNNPIELTKNYVYPSTMSCRDNQSENKLIVSHARENSVIMKVENHKIIEIKSDEINNLTNLRQFSEDEINYECRWSECQRQFNNFENFVTHVNKCHIKKNFENLFYCKWHKCPRSNRGFDARYKFLVHLRTHTKEKPYQCNECKKCFSRAENLKIHMRTHSGEKPYVCPFDGCNKAYSNSSDRFKHSKTHFEEKPYYCKVEGCGKRYTDPSSLRKHIKQMKHTPNKMEYGSDGSSNSDNSCDSMRDTY